MRPRINYTANYVHYNTGYVLKSQKTLASTRYHMQIENRTGVSDLASLFVHQECFRIAYQYFMWVF